jgi:enediyne biosynthesis protein E4
VKVTRLEIAVGAAIAVSVPTIAFQQTPRAVHFLEAASAANLNFTHTNGASGRFYLHEEMGSGVALFDYDNDSDLDVFMVQGAASPAAAAGRPAARTAPTSRLFRNDLSAPSKTPRRLRFTDVTDQAGVGVVSQGMGAAVGDYNNDGFADLFITSFGPDRLFRNNGNGTFSDVTKEAGVSDALWSASASFLDYDRDGDLDLFVANYLAFSEADNRQCFDTTHVRHYCPPRVFPPAPDRLYRNEGGGRFSNVTDSAGLSKADGNGLGVVAGDFSGDGWLDIYVANDATPNQLWVNQRNGTFLDEGVLSGAAVNAGGHPEASMGIGAGDFDADGDEDLFVTNDIGETFVLYMNDGHGLFVDARVRAGIAAPTAAYTGFGTDWFDYDNDGWLDLFIANGAVSIVPKQRGQPRPYRMNNQLFRNTGKARLEEVPAASAGPDFSDLEIGRGAAFGDLDNDGDVDIVVNNNGGRAKLLLNQTGTKHQWLQVRLDQGPANRMALGAWVGLHRNGRPTLWRRVRTDGSYLSASDSRLHFGLGATTDMTGIDVHWPDGARERFGGQEANRLVTLKRGTGTIAPAAR